MTEPLPDHHTVVFLLGAERVEARGVPVPRPGPGELLLRIEAATTCGTDVKVFRRGGHPRMLAAPCPFGHEMAGAIAAVGEGVEGWQPGDRAVAANSAPCGACSYCRRGRENLCRDLAYLNGAFGEYLLLPHRFAAGGLHRIPDGLPAREAALAEPLACVLHGIETCDLEGPCDALVLGAGPIGLLFTAVLAREGHRVVAADPNPPRLAAARDLGAASTVAVERGGSEGEALRAAAADPDGFDLAIDATGSPAAWQAAVASVRPGGTVNLFGGCPPGTAFALDAGRLHYGELTVRGAYHHRPATFARAVELLARRDLGVERLLSAERPLSETEDALRSMMRREALKVVLRP